MCLTFRSFPSSRMHILVDIYTWRCVCILTVSVSEVLPKDKKVREDKMVTIGVASVDLSPLLQGGMMHVCIHLSSSVGS